MFTNFTLKVNLKVTISLDFLFRVIIFCQFYLKSEFEVIISLDFLFKVMIVAYFDLKEIWGNDFPFKVTIFC